MSLPQHHDSEGKAHQQLLDILLAARRAPVIKQLNENIN
jgi:hypothetical protein